MQKKSAGSENLIGVGGSTKDGAAKFCGQLVVGLLSNFKNRILGGWLSVPSLCVIYAQDRKEGKGQKVGKEGGLCGGTSYKLGYAQEKSANQYSKCLSLSSPHS